LGISSKAKTEASDHTSFNARPAGGEAASRREIYDFKTFAGSTSEHSDKPGGATAGIFA
jgi:hypothetical protein